MMMITRCLVFLVFYLFHVTGTNILLNKPSVQPGSFTNGGDSFPSHNANDGSKTSLPAVAQSQNNKPYWQGDLQGFYTVTSISVTSTEYNGWASYLKKAIIGVTVQDIGCSEFKVTRCGQWPDEDLHGHTIVFNCPNAGAVRFIRIWREGTMFLNLGEVEVEGVPSILTGIVFDKVIQQKITPTKSLSVGNATDCGTICHQTQPCLAFSYSHSEQPNCVLATDVTMTSDVKWISYKVDMCVQLPTCDVSGLK